MDSREPREDHELAGLRQMILDFEDFINTPPQYEELRRVCEYRNELYRHWDPLARAVLDALRRPSPVAESTPAADKIATTATQREAQLVGLVREMACVLLENGGDVVPALKAASERALAALSTPTDATAVEAEREACAKAVEALKTCGCNGSHGSCLVDDPYDHAAEVIRSRTPKES